MVILPNKKDYMPDSNLGVVMEEILNREMYTYYLLSAREKANLRRAFTMGFEFARAGYLSRGIK